MPFIDTFKNHLLITILQYYAVYRVQNYIYSFKIFVQMLRFLLEIEYKTNIIEITYSPNELGDLSS